MQSIAMMARTKRQPVVYQQLTTKCPVSCIRIRTAVVHWQDRSPTNIFRIKTLSLSSSHTYCLQQPWFPGKRGSWRSNLSHLLLLMGLCSSLTANNLMVFCLHNVVWQFQMIWIFIYNYEYGKFCRYEQFDHCTPQWSTTKIVQS